MCGIQFLVFSDQVAVHLFVCGFEVVHVLLVPSRSGESHGGSRPETPYAQTPPAPGTRRKKEQPEKKKKKEKKTNNQITNTKPKHETRATQTQKYNQPTLAHKKRQKKALSSRITKSLHSRSEKQRCSNNIRKPLCREPHH